MSDYRGGSDPSGGIIWYGPIFNKMVMVWSRVYGLLGGDDVLERSIWNRAE